MFFEASLQTPAPDDPNTICLESKHIYLANLARHAIIVRMNTHHTARKRFGQNFLHDQMVIRQIIQAIHPTPSDHIVEIGPGLGALTTKILPIVKTMDVVELDRDIIPKLEKTCHDLTFLCGGI